MKRMITLRADEIATALPMKKAIEVNAHAFKQHYLGQTNIPLRTFIKTEHGPTGFMPGSYGNKVMGLKIANIRPENRNRGLPTVTAQILLYDIASADPIALLDGTYITWLRTAAGSGAATEYLAKKNVNKLAVFGAGNQAQFHIDAMVTVRPSIKLVHIVNRTFENAEKLATSLKSDKKYEGITFVATKNSKEALKNADIICATTSSQKPLFDGNDVEEGAHINIIGSHDAQTQEVDETTVVRAKVVVDERKACLVEAGDIIVPLKKGLIKEDHILAELGELVQGKQIRTSDKDITLFKSVGNAVQDLATGLAAYESAVKLKLGTEVNLSKL